MERKSDFLQVRGSELINRGGETVRLRGFCLGGWMNMENFMTGYPGHESGMRTAVSEIMGEGKARFFFDRFLHYFLMQEDLQYLKSLGCNVIRIPFNYRHFESDHRPMKYKPEGFALLDKVIHWARELQLYVILDLHAAQGWQSRGWHCDNPSRTATLWGQKDFEDRVVALWEAIAERYRDETFVAGYNVVNEPEAEDPTWLNQLYRRVIEAIRGIDTDHILFLEGNHYSQKFDELDPPFDDNTVYSSHLYVEPGLELVEYPGEFQGQFYDRGVLEERYAQRTSFMREHDVPHWLGEFGCIYSSPALEESRLRLMADLLDIAESHRDHWTVWSYKDIGMMGMVYLDPDSEWMERTRSIRNIKSILRCDSWIERQDGQLDEVIRELNDRTKSILEGYAVDCLGLEENLYYAVCDGLLSQMLQHAFAEQFRGMGEEAIDEMMQSFAFQNCIERAGLTELIKNFTT